MILHGQSYMPVPSYQPSTTNPICIYPSLMHAFTCNVIVHSFQFTCTRRS
jgi:hypothetical protein